MNDWVDWFLMIVMLLVSIGVGCAIVFLWKDW